MEPRESLRAADFIVAGVALLPIGFHVAFALVIAPTFEAMFADFGSELPVVTRLALVRWVPLLTAVLIAAAAFVPLAVTARARARRLSAVLAMIVGVFAGVAFIAAMYVPIFELAGTIK